MITHLDYAGAKLSMECNNPIEEAYRVNACAKEPWTVRFIEAIPPGAIFWDIGANVGSYTMIAAYRGLYTIAIEPSVNSYGALFRNLAMNNLLDRVLMLCSALGETATLDWLHYQDLRSGASSHLIGGSRKQTFHKQLVQVLRLDDLVKGLPLPDRQHYIKLDVDGSELAVLRGAPELLSDARLRAIMVEMESAPEEIPDLLTRAGFTLREHIMERPEALPTLEGHGTGRETNYGWFERPA